VKKYFLQLRSLIGGRGLDTKLLFVMSMCTACAMRLMCFVGFSLLDAGRVGASRRQQRDMPLGGGAGGAEFSHDENSDFEFYARAVVLLFDLPDFVLVSTYVLLLMVWTECFFASRRHWLSSAYHKRLWHIYYLVFNVVLYGTQMFLYTNVLFEDLMPKVDGIKLLYLVLACITLLVPLLHPVAYVVISLRLAGFPRTSPGAQARLRELTHVVCYWTFGRAVWGAAVATTVFQRTIGAWMRSSASATTFTVVSLFVLTEIIPYILTLDSAFLKLLDQDGTLCQPQLTPQPPPSTPPRGYGGYAAVPPGTHR